MKTINSLLICGVGAYLATLGLVSASSDASAAGRRMHSSVCTSLRDDRGSDVRNGQQLENNLPQATSFYCPVPSDSTLSHSQTTTLNVYGHNPESATSGSSTKACVKHSTSNSYQCGTASVWDEGTGLVASDIDLDRWTSNPTAFPYLLVYMMPETHLYGFYMYN